MEESRLDNEIQRIYRALPFLWEKYGYHVKYFTRDYGMYNHGFVVGLESDSCRLVFEKETKSKVEPIRYYIGKHNSPFLPLGDSYLIKDGWYTLPGLLFWLTGVQIERDKNVDKDLDYISQYTQLYIDRLLDLFQYPDELEKKLEYFRNLYKERQITVEKVRAERARLQSLGLDSSLESAITNLHGGRK
jgi:hypothetical protein